MSSNTLRFLLLLGSFLLMQCSSKYEPDCAPYQKEGSFYEYRMLEQAQQCWTILKDKKKESQWLQATQEYNKAVAALADVMQCENDANGKVDFGNHAFEISHGYGDRVGDERLYQTCVQADKVNLDILKECVTIPGVGVPVVGRLVREAGQNLQSQINDISGVHTVTVILDFDRKKHGKPVLRLIPRLENEFVNIGKQRHNLAANFSAPLAYLWEQSKVDDKKLLGFFRPSKAIDTMGLFFMEAYDPDKIPIIFTHGLESSPETFSNLSNRLLASPEIRKNYQFWYFGYPTGVSWVVSSDAFRKAITNAREKFDPQHKSKNFDQMVLVSHSMGGLISRYSMSENPWGIIRYALKPSEQEKLAQQGPRYIESIYHTADSGKKIDEFGSTLNFNPLPYPKRVVFLATPHKGSDFADNWIARLGIALISLPQNLLEQTYDIVTLNNHIFSYPEEILNGMSSISQLSPGNFMIKGLNDLKIPAKVPAHSIIGDRGKGNTPDSSDGFVKYKSSHLDWSVSEKIVPSDHSVQDNPETAVEMQRILHEHLKVHRGRNAFRFPQGMPIKAVVHSTNGDESEELHLVTEQAS